MYFPTLSTLLFASTISAHGIISKPYPRVVGAASLAACGSAVTNNIKGDNTSHVEGLPEAARTDSAYHADKCNLWLCRGLQFADSTDIQTYTPGQVVPINVLITIKHTGPANVSIVSTKTNKVIKQLLYWDVYADQNVRTLPANNTNFDVTIPTDLGSECSTAGDCVIQWWWYGTQARQTYESCIDFKVAAPTMKNKRFWRE